MAEYVPDDAEICAQWLSYVTEESPSGDWDALPEVDAVARWNAWLEALKRTERAAAWDEGYEVAMHEASGDYDLAAAKVPTNPYRIELGELQSHP